jgi:hypothetical protein
VFHDEKNHEYFRTSTMKELLLNHSREKMDLWCEIINNPKKQWSYKQINISFRVLPFWESKSALTAEVFADFLEDRQELFRIIGFEESFEQLAKIKKLQFDQLFHTYNLSIFSSLGSLKRSIYHTTIDSS